MKSIHIPARRIALILVIALLNQVFSPSIALALTSGPTQPEVSSFTPAGTSDMVDLFTGDFQYNIPLLDVGGYPINISYSAGPGMDEEASWVGLGWNLNPGVINRQMRGIPDDFRGDSILKAFKMRPDITTGVNVGGGIELTGVPIPKNSGLTGGNGIGLSFTRGVYYNTYRGYGIVSGITPTLTIAKFSKTKLTASLGLNYDSQNGSDILPLIEYKTNESESKVNYSLKSSIGINSRRGLRDLSISYNYKSSKLKYLPGKIGGSTSFSGSTYTPTADLPLENNSFTFHGSTGLELYGLNGHFFVDGYRADQRVAKNRQKQASFGYMHSQLAESSDVMDFNRERNGLPWRENMPALPPAFGTNDLFAASGQGGAGQFRLIRNDIGYYRDAYHANTNASRSFGIELGFSPNLVKAGLNVNVTNVNSSAQAWKENNPLTQNTTHTDWDSTSLYEPVFFKNTGEMTMTDSAFFKFMGKSRPAQAELESSTGATKTAFQFSSNQIGYDKSVFDAGTVLKRSRRERRNDVWQYLTGREASKQGLEKNIVSYKRGVGQIRVSKDATDCAIDSTLSRIRYKKAHHLSEISIVKPDGSRYVYGIPAYNVLQKEVSFSVHTSKTDGGSGLIQYDIDDNSLSNNQGRDAYYSAESLPAYPYAFLLTSVLSPDYIDRTGDGITNDDYGTAVRINYSKNKKLYHWRTPHGKDPANINRIARFSPGRKSDNKTKKASYIYGTKEIWYVHSIESATMTAQFYTSGRLDGMGALDEDGRIDTSAALLKLDKIELYSKSDLQKYGNAATPIKTVHFSYSYELCPQTPNSISTEKGKLTLKRIYFTYGKSGRGTFNAYSFEYKNGAPGGEGNRFFYNMTNVDRWGNYKVHHSGYPGTSDFPYALQDTTLNGTNNGSIYEYAAAWCLTSIKLPSGGTISVEYEPDDYAYVQNKRAGQMCFIKGFSRTVSGNIDSLLYTDMGDSDMSRYIWVDIESMKLPAGMIPDADAFKERCLKDIGNIWFSMDVKMNLLQSFRETVTGYMEYDSGLPLGTKVVSGELVAVGIPVKIVETDNGRAIHPVTKAALQLMRLELPDLAYPEAAPGNAFEAVLNGLIGHSSALNELFNNFDASKMRMKSAQYAGCTINNNLKSSWIRLCNPRFKKYGGGHRVKKIMLNDQWDQMASGQAAATYGQLYTYTATQKLKIGGDTEDVTISSGVASWEPTIGSEENLWREPVTFRDDIKLAPDNSYYVEKPFGESLFPAPVVGYSNVKVQNIGYADNPRVGSGWMTYEFYTARDFPTIVDYSSIKRHKEQSNKLQNFFKIKVKDHLSLTQGFVVEVNDMHGKIKKESSFAQNGVPISSTSYEYKTDDGSNTPLHINNTVKVATPNGSIGTERLLGLDMEIWQDFREESTQTEGTGFAPNTDGFWGFVFPIIIFTGLSIFNKEDVRFRSAVTTKYIRRTGILSKITKMQNGSTITTENLLWDSETGAVLATKTQNEFEDPIYQFTYPAHWAYDGMGMAYKNAGARVKAGMFTAGIPDLAGYDEIFTEGDEVAAFRTPSRWVFPSDVLRLTAYKTTPYTNLRFYTDAGTLFSSVSGRKYNLLVIRSGRRNLAGTSIETIVSKTNPLEYVSIQDFASDAANNRIVNASASTFKDMWNRNCNCPEDLSSSFGTREESTQERSSAIPGVFINPYRHGIKGNWRTEKNYIMHLNRQASKLLTSVGVTNIRTDGSIINFVPFWDWVVGSDEWKPNPSNSYSWVLQSTIKAYDFKGNPTEEEDALSISSSSYFGYQGNLNTAVAHNTRLKQGMFDGFEDYYFNVNPGCDSLSCDFTHHGRFDIKMVGSGTGEPSSEVAHTGKYSFKITNNTTYGISVTLDTNANQSILQVTTDSSAYSPGPAACPPSFKPSPGVYLVSGWLYTGNDCSSVKNGPRIAVSEQYADSVQIRPSGPVIDGWQRIYGKVAITTSTGQFQIRLENPLNQPVYFDDIRFHPWLGNMKSFVYDPVSLRLMAILDENNYATFYEYDDEGILIRVKRETERGIMTIEEHRSYLKYSPEED